MLLVCYPPYTQPPPTPPRGLGFFTALRGHQCSPVKDKMKPKRSHWRVLLLCLIWESESHCHSTSECPLSLILPFVFSSVRYLFFSTFFIPTILFHSHVSLSVSQVVHICEWKRSSIPLVGFACVCIHTKLLWYFEAFHGLFSNLCGVLDYQNLLSWERGKQSQPMRMEGETRAEGEFCDFHYPQFISLDQMRPYEYIWAQLSTVHPDRLLLTVHSHRKQARRTLHPTGIEEVLSLCTQLVVSAINQHSPGITGAVLCVAVWPDVWPHCDCSLG